MSSTRSTNYHFVPTHDPDEAISDSIPNVIEAYDKFTTMRTPQLFSHRTVNGDIEKIRGLIGSGGILEYDENPLNELRIILQNRQPTDDALINEVFNYLNARLVYHDTRQKRSASTLTADYKVLIVGNSWVKREHKDNPVSENKNNGVTDHINELNSLMCQETNQTIKEFYAGQIQALRSSFNLTYACSRDQFYTIDCNPTMLPDICACIEDIEAGELPEQYFDFITFEAFGFISLSEFTRAITIALNLLKPDGLLLYYPYTPLDDSSNLMNLIAKSGYITQAKLDAIPNYIRSWLSLERRDISPLMRASHPLTKEITLDTMEPTMDCRVAFSSSQ